MGVTLDILVIIIIAIFVALGFKKGALKTVISVVGTLIASSISVFFSGPIARWIYDSMIKTSFDEKIEDAMKLAAQTGSSDIINKIYDTLPQFVNNSLFNFGISDKELSAATSNGAQAIESLISPIVISFISIITAFIIFVILMVVIKIISKFICAAVDNSAIGVVNRFFGALIGLIEGFIIVFVIMFVLRLAIPHIADVPAIISDETISSSTVFKGIYNSEILTGIISSTTVSPNVDTCD